MSSVVHFKLQSSLGSEVVRFHGVDICVRDLKEEIARIKNFEKYKIDYSLIIKNDNTKEVYADDNMIPKNSSVVVSRIPLVCHKNGLKCAPVPQPVKVKETKIDMSFLGQSTALSEMNISEDDKLSQVMHQATEEFHGVDFNRAKKLVRRPVPQNYICHGCGLTGHYIEECPRMKLKKNDETIRKLKVTAGIPKTFLTYVNDINTPGVLLSSCGKLVVPKIETESKGTKDRSDTDTNSGRDNQEELPKDFICHICNDIKTDAVITPCCKNSACYFCVIENILKYWPQKCPSCKKVGITVAEVTPDEEMRTAILKFRTHPDYLRKYLEPPSFTPQKADINSGYETCPQVNLPLNESGFKIQLLKPIEESSGHTVLKKMDRNRPHVKRQVLNENVHGSTDTRMKRGVKRKLEDSNNFAKRFKEYFNFTTHVNNRYENKYLLQQTPVQLSTCNRFESHYWSCIVGSSKKIIRFPIGQRIL